MFQASGIDWADWTPLDVLCLVIVAGVVLTMIASAIRGN